MVDREVTDAERTRLVGPAVEPQAAPADRRWTRLVPAGEVVAVLAWLGACGAVLALAAGHAAQVSGVALAAAFTAVTGLMVAMVMTYSRRGWRRTRQNLRDTSLALQSMELVTDPALSFLPLDELLDSLLARTAKVMGGDLVTVFLLSLDRQSLTVRASYGDDPIAVGETVPLGAGVIGAVAAQGEARIVDDVTLHHPVMAQVRDRVSSLVVAPLMVGGRVIGVVQVGNREPNAFVERDVQVLQLVAERAAASIERARLDESERRSRLAAEHARRHVDVLARASDVLATALESYDEAFVRLVDAVVPLFADWFAVDLVEGDGRVTRVATGSSGEPARGAADGSTTGRWLGHPDGERLVRRALETGTPELVLDAARLGAPHRGQLALPGRFTDAAPAGGVESMMVVPVHVRGLAFGALSLATWAGRRGYRRSDLDTALALAERVAVAVERVLLWRETRQAEALATRQAGQLRRLVEAALGVNAALEEPEVLRVLADHARRVLEADWAVVCSRRAGDVIKTEVLSPQMPLVAGVDAGVITAASADALNARLPVHGPIRPNGRVPLSWVGMALPSANGGGAQRAIVLFSTTKNDFSTEDDAVVLLMTQMASVALENARLYQVVQGNEERLRAVVESSPLAIAELDLQGRAQWWNSAAAAMFGWPERPEPVHEPLRLPSRAGGGLELRGLLERASAGLPTVGAEIGAMRPDGGALELSIATAPLRDHAGNVSGILAVIEDVTESVAMLEQFYQAERIGAMARLAGAVAHDFNNLLTVILGSSEILARQVRQPAAVEEIAAIQRAGHRAAALTSQLLSIGRRAPVQAVVTDPDSAISAMTPMLARALGPKVTVEHLKASSGVRIMVDPAEFERAMLNLALNAHDAMPDGGRFVVTTGSWSTGEQREVAITVADDGAGMTPDVASHCFEPFFTTKGRARGTGLGLAAVHATVTAADGRVTVDSLPGAGTTFTLVFPEVDGEPETEEIGEVPDESTGVEMVFVTEDEDELRRLVVQTLEWRGYQVVAASSASEALDIAAGMRRRPGLLLTDVLMPEMSGVELAERLRKRWRTLPVLFVSGHLDEVELDPETFDDLTDLLPKPFAPDQLARRVRQVIDRAARRSRRSRGATPGADEPGEANGGAPSVAGRVQAG